MAKSIFEKTMQACLESKKSTAKVSNKKVNEAVKRAPKKLKEDEEVIDDIDVIDDEEEPETMDDIEDDIVVVVDPEVSEDEVIAAAEGAQDIIDGTPEGEIPMSDEYVGDLAYTCPICGNTFFVADEMHDGDECPVCGDTPDSFLLVGGVEEPEEAIAEDEDEEVAEPDEELEPVMDIADDEEEEVIDEPEEESKKPSRKPLVVDESTFNPFMTKFIRENYKNAKSFKVVGAKRIGKRLSLECKIVFKSGKSKKVTLTTEGFKADAKKLAFYDNGGFKVEESKKAKVAPFIFDTDIKDGVIRCEGMKYNLITRSKTEGKKIQISGRLIKESKKANFQKGRKVR